MTTDPSPTSNLLTKRTPGSEPEASAVEAAESAEPAEAPAENAAEPDAALEEPAPEEEPDDSDEDGVEPEAGDAGADDMDADADEAFVADPDVEDAEEEDGDGEVAGDASDESAEADADADAGDDKASLANAAPQILEALLFAADQPLSAAKLGAAMGKRFDAKRIREMIDELNAFYAEHNRAFEILPIAGGFQMLTRGDYHKWVAELHKHRRQDKLSASAIETLSIVAYRQPVLRVTIDDIRGVQSGPLLRALLERGLIKVVGHQNVPGNPRLYGTTKLFLEHFGLKSLRELPKVFELAKD